MACFWLILVNSQKEAANLWVNNSINKDVKWYHNLRSYLSYPSRIFKIEAMGALLCIFFTHLELF